MQQKLSETRRKFRRHLAAIFGMGATLLVPHIASAAVLVATFEGTLGTLAAEGDNDITNTAAWQNLTNLSASDLTLGTSFTGRLIIDKGLVDPGADLQPSSDVAEFNPTNDGNPPTLTPPPNFLVLELTINGNTYRGGFEQIPTVPFIPAMETVSINQILRREQTDDVLSFTTFYNAARTDSNGDDFVEQRLLSYSFAGIPFADALPDAMNPPDLSTATAGVMTATLLSSDPTDEITARLRGTINSAVGLNTILGSAPEFAVLPDLGDDPSDGFDFLLTDIGTDGVGTNIPIFIDPVVAIGYDYEIFGGPNFASVLLPVLPGGDNMFLIDFAGLASPLAVTGGTIFNFTDHVTGGVSAFRVTEIDAAENLDPNDPNAFITGLTFVDSGTVDMKMTAIAFDTDQPGQVTISEPAPLGLTLMALGALWWQRRRRAT